LFYLLCTPTRRSSDLRLAELRVGAPAVAFTLSIAIAGTLLCATVPVARFWRARGSLNLREGGRGASAGGVRLRLRAAITSLQIRSEEHTSELQSRENL